MGVSPAAIRWALAHEGDPSGQPPSCIRWDGQRVGAAFERRRLTERQREIWTATHIIRVKASQERGDPYGTAPVGAVWLGGELGYGGREADSVWVLQADGGQYLIADDFGEWKRDTMRKMRAWKLDNPVSTRNRKVAAWTLRIGAVVVLGAAVAATAGAFGPAAAGVAGSIFGLGAGASPAVIAATLGTAGVGFLGSAEAAARSVQAGGDLEEIAVTTYDRLPESSRAKLTEWRGDPSAVVRDVPALFTVNPELAPPPAARPPPGANTQLPTGGGRWDHVPRRGSGVAGAHTDAMPDWDAVLERVRGGRQHIGRAPAHDFAGPGVSTSAPGVTGWVRAETTPMTAEEAGEFLLGLYRVDIKQLRGGAPPISGALARGEIRYCPNYGPDGQIITRFATLRDIWRSGCGDCDELSAAVAAEWTLSGRPSVPYLYQAGPGLLHAVVRDVGTGALYDPSRTGGMGRPA